MDTIANSKQHAVDFLKIDMRNFISKGYTPEKEMDGKLVFNGNDIAICVLKSDCMYLFYKKNDNFSCKYVKKKIRFDCQHPHKESMIQYFVCQRCLRRTLVLYHRKMSFICRKCSNMTIESRHAYYEFVPYKGQ